MAIFNGGNGNRPLLGGDGTDTLHGGIGDDLYRIIDTTDIIIEDLDAGIDTVESRVSFTLAANLETMTLPIPLLRMWMLV